jgi:hypothetical protein
MPWPRDRWIIVALVVAALLAFGSTLTFGFIFDDQWIVHGNTAIRGWSSLLTLWTKPYWVTENGGGGLYRPLLMVIFSVLWNAGLRFPIWFHLLAVAAHASVTVLVWQVLRRAVSALAAALGALWFAVHPLHVEAVANIANSSEVFVTIVTLALVLVVVRGDEQIGPDGRVPWMTATLAGALYGAALLIKESGVTAPALALLMLWGWRAPSVGRNGNALSSRMIWRRWARMVFTCAGAFCVVVAARVAVLGAAVGGSFAAPGLRTLSTAQRIWAMLSVGPKIVGLLVWPRTLNPLYGPRVLGGHFGPNLPAIAFVTGVALLAGASWRFATHGDRRVSTAIAWIAIAFFPASNLLVATGQVLAERTLYLPSVGATLLLAVGIDALVVRARPALTAFRRPATVIGGVLVGLFVFGVARETRHRARAWGDHKALLTQLIAADPGDYHPYWALAVLEQEAGKPDVALQMLERAYRLEQGDRELSIAYAKALIERQPALASIVLARLMSRPDERAKVDAVSLYLEALGRGYGADSVLAAGQRLFADAPLPTTAFYVGSAHEVRGERAAAVASYRAGLGLASLDSVGARRLRERLDALSR